MNDNIAAETPQPRQIFKRVATCPPVLFSLSSLFLLGGAAAVLPSLLSIAAVCIAVAAFGYTLRSAWRSAKENRTSKMPYVGQAVANLAVAAVTTANIVQEKGADIAHQFSTQPFLEASVALAGDQSLLHAAGLALAYLLGASGAWLEVDNKRREERKLPPRGRLCRTETHWSLSDVAVNLVSPAAMITGLAGVGLSFLRRDEHDDIVVTGPKSFAVKHVTPLRVITSSYAVSAPVMFLLNPLSGIGVLLDMAASCCFDGEDRPLNRDLVKDMRAARIGVVRTVERGLAAASLAIADLAQAQNRTAPLLSHSVSRRMSATTWSTRRQFLHSEIGPIRVDHHAFYRNAPIEGAEDFGSFMYGKPVGLHHRLAPAFA